MSNILDIVQLNQLADEGGYGVFTALSPFSCVMLLSCVGYLEDLNNWQGADADLTVNEIDDIQNKVARAIEELMTNTIGMIFTYPNSVIPDYVLLCDGATYNRVDYPLLYDALDPAFRIDANTFTTPDLTDKVIKQTGTIAATGGSDVINLTVPQLPTHNHSTSGAVTLIPIGELPAVSVLTPTPTVTGNTGSGADINIDNPYLSLNYVIVAR